MLHGCCVVYVWIRFVEQQPLIIALSHTPASMVFSISSERSIMQYLPRPEISSIGRSWTRATKNHQSAINGARFVVNRATIEMRSGKIDFCILSSLGTKGFSLVVILTAFVVRCFFVMHRMNVSSLTNLNQSRRI